MAGLAEDQIYKPGHIQHGREDQTHKPGHRQHGRQRSIGRLALSCIVEGRNKKITIFFSEHVHKVHYHSDVVQRKSRDIAKSYSHVTLELQSCDYVHLFTTSVNWKCTCTYVGYLLQLNPELLWIGNCAHVLRGFELF